MSVIEEYWRVALGLGGVRELSVETLDARSSGLLGYETGRFLLMVNGPNGGTVINRGRFIELLRREPGGR